MKQQEAGTTEQKLSHAIDLGINFLHEHQYPNGEFCCYYAPDDKMEEWCVPDSIVFASAVIASCLLPLKGLDKVKKIHDSAVNFLRYQMMRGGVWNYFTKWNPLFKFSPADIDDTVYTCHVFRSLNVDLPDNGDILLSNRNSKGLFYTWIIARPAQFKLNKEYMMVVLREFKYPLKSLMFWFGHQVSRNDVDAVVNANVLFYLGLSNDTLPIVDYLLDILYQNKEEACDHWYHNRFIFYYCLSRNYSTVKELEPAKELIIERIYTRINEGGGFGTSAFDTALAICTLLNLKHTLSEIGKSIPSLLDSQTETGYWKRNVFFYAGSSKVVGWGSEEIVTGFCLEALANYNIALTADKPID